MVGNRIDYGRPDEYDYQVVGRLNIYMAVLSSSSERRIISSNRQHTLTYTHSRCFDLQLSLIHRPLDSSPSQDAAYYSPSVCPGRKS
jgi:hypothetical protein